MKGRVDGRARRRRGARVSIFGGGGRGGISVDGSASAHQKRMWVRYAVGERT